MYVEIKRNVNLLFPRVNAFYFLNRVVLVGSTIKSMIFFIKFTFLGKEVENRRRKNRKNDKH
jgi:hypothetical protein